MGRRKVERASDRDTKAVPGRIDPLQRHCRAWPGL